MDHIFLVILLTSLLNSCHCRPLGSRQKKDSATDSPAVHFSLNEHHFKIELLSIPKIQPTLPNAVTDVKCAIEEPETETITKFAMINVSPKIATRTEAKPAVIPEKNDDSMAMWNKVKSVYRELGDVLQEHENEMLSLAKGRESPKPKLGVNTLTGDTSIQLKINALSNGDDGLKKDNTQPNDSGPNIGDPNSLNIHVHAEPPLKMRIGYPKPASDVDSIKKLLRLYSRGTSYPATQQDSPYELNTQRSSQQDQSIEQEMFLRRGSKILLSMWKRFTAQKIKNKSQELEYQNFREDVDDAKLTNRYL